MFTSWRLVWNTRSLAIQINNEWGNKKTPPVNHSVVSCSFNDIVLCSSWSNNMSKQIQSFCECKILVVQGCFANVCQQGLHVLSLRLPLLSPCIHGSGMIKRLDNKAFVWVCYRFTIVCSMSETTLLCRTWTFDISAHSGGFRLFLPFLLIISFRFVRKDPHTVQIEATNTQFLNMYEYVVILSHLLPCFATQQDGFWRLCLLGLGRSS